MPNWNPLTNASGGKGATPSSQYYNGTETNFGEYGFIYLQEIVDNFTAAYTGVGKILANVMGGDINFHAHRALQELSYDTLVSCKSQEIEVCPSLKMPLPHDYVNYVKLTSVDNSGIEHIIYPTRHTSNPFAISQSDGCVYDISTDGTITHQEDCDAATSGTCDPTEFNAWWNFAFGTTQDDTLGYAYWRDINGPLQTPTTFIVGDNEVVIENELELLRTVTQKMDEYCICVNSSPDNGISCGTQQEWLFDWSPEDFDKGYKSQLPSSNSKKLGLFIENDLLGEGGVLNAVAEAKNKMSGKMGGPDPDPTKDWTCVGKNDDPFGNGTTTYTCKNVGKGNGNYYSKQECLEDCGNSGMCWSILTSGIWGGWSKIAITPDWGEPEIIAFAYFACSINLSALIEDAGGDQWVTVCDVLEQYWGGQKGSDPFEGDGCLPIKIEAPEVTGVVPGVCIPSSDTWDRYSGASGTSVGIDNTLNPAVDNSNYFTNSGGRYGLNPENAQINGSFFMDCLRGNIHFSSALSGKTIILKYLSDGHGTPGEAIVPKLAEEAMYKWIAYGCAQARTDVDQNTVARLKKEKFAETRKAKIRLSNIKIEEISQVFRGKSKWIKH